MSLSVLLPAFSLLFPAHAEEVPKKMIQHMAKAIGCDESGVSATFLGEEPLSGTKVTKTSWTIEGCGEPFMATYWEYGSWTFIDDRKLRGKAPFDLSCDKSALKYTFIDPMNRGVEGCGQRLTYVLTSSGWVANVSSR